MRLVGQKVPGVQAALIATNVGAGLFDYDVLVRAAIGGLEHSAFIGVPKRLVHNEAVVEQDFAPLFSGFFPPTGDGGGGPRRRREMGRAPVFHQFAVRPDNGVDHVAIVRDVSAAPKGAVAIVDEPTGTIRPVGQYYRSWQSGRGPVKGGHEGHGLIVIGGVNGDELA